MSFGRGQFFGEPRPEPRPSGPLPPGIDPEEAYRHGNQLCTEAAERYRWAWQLIIQRETIHPEPPEGTVHAHNVAAKPFDSSVVLVLGSREMGLHPSLVKGAVDSLGRPIENYWAVRYPAGEIEQVRRLRLGNEDPTLDFLNQVLAGRITYHHLDPAHCMYVRPDLLAPPPTISPAQFVIAGFMTSFALRRLRRKNTPHGRSLEGIGGDLDKPNLQAYGYLASGKDRPRPFNAETLMGIGAKRARYALNPPEDPSSEAFWL